MIIKNIQELNNSDYPLLASRKHPQAQNVLMVTPNFFDVEYAINPHMLDHQGNLQKIDKKKAYQEWQNLKETYEKLGFKVFTIEGITGLPDMVFCANTSFPYLDKNHQKKVIKVSMHSPKRKKEVDHVMSWYRSKDYQIISMDNDQDFEGNGDALIHSSWILGGHGFRTNKSVYQELSTKTELPVVLLRLVSEHFYHLDTCLTILNEKTIAIVKEGFAPSSLELLSRLYPHIIEIDHEEGLKNFAANAHSPDGKNVILQSGSTNFCQKLRQSHLSPIEIDTGEYLKSGGSVFCMKMMFY